MKDESGAIKLPILVVAVALGASDLPAERVVLEHSGATDPLTEGFSRGQAGAAVTGDMGLEAWNIQGPVGSFPRYDANLAAGDVAEMEATGFRVTATLRNLLAPDDAADLGNIVEVSLTSVGQFTLLFGADASGNPVLLKGDLCCLGGTPIALDPSVTGAGYHTFQMLYNPNVSATQVELLVDGISHGMLSPATSNFGNRFTWGASDSGGTWNSNWNVVRLETEILPPPSTPLLVGRHVGRNDPRTEGWSGGNGGGTPVTDALGEDAWNMQHTGLFNRYDRTIPDNQVAAMATEGWRWDRPHWRAPPSTKPTSAASAVPRSPWIPRSPEPAIISMKWSTTRRFRRPRWRSWSTGSPMD